MGAALVGNLRPGRSRHRAAVVRATRCEPDLLRRPSHPAIRHRRLRCSRRLAPRRGIRDPRPADWADFTTRAVDCRGHRDRSAGDARGARRVRRWSMGGGFDFSLRYWPSEQASEPGATCAFVPPVSSPRISARCPWCSPPCSCSRRVPRRSSSETIRTVLAADHTTAPVVVLVFDELPLGACSCEPTEASTATAFRGSQSSPRSRPGTHGRQRSPRTPSWPSLRC